jgi:hypothetical protein
MAVVLLAVGAPLAVDAQTSLKAKVAFRAVTRDDIAAFKLPSTTQISGGLSTVGVGQPAHLEVLVDSKIPAAEIVAVNWTITRKPGSSNAVVTDSVLPATVPTYEPADRLEYQLATRMLLRPDVAGVYTLTATIETKNNGTAELPVIITASNYTGSKECTSCHGLGASRPWSMAAAWSKTSHATLFRDGLNGVASDHYGANCIACHTVGYDRDPLAVNGGFDDVATALKWTFPTATKAGTYDAIPDALKNLGGIQCENCHGPGSRHVGSGGDPLLISISSGSGVCAQCHGALTHHSKNGQWNNSVHAVVTPEAAGSGREGCVGCHTGTGFMGRIKGSTPLDTGYSPIGCQTCHEAHGETLPQGGAHFLRTVDLVTLKDGTTVKGGGTGMLCMNCHQSRQNAAVYAETAAASARFGPHHSPQADMLAGVNGVTYGKSIPSSAHGLVVENTCVTCHMQEVEDASPALTHAGGHTFRVRAEGGATIAAEDLVGACQGCHGQRLTALNFELLDYDNDGKVEGVQTEVQHLLDKLALLLPPAGTAKTSLTINSSWTRPELKAAYNWQFVMEDGSLGIHNMAYTVGLLKASIADLEAKK